MACKCRIAKSSFLISSGSHVCFTWSSEPTRTSTTITQWNNSLWTRNCTNRCTSCSSYYARRSGTYERLSRFLLRNCTRLQSCCWTLHGCSDSPKNTSSRRSQHSYSILIGGCGTTHQSYPEKHAHSQTRDYSPSI